MDGEGQHARVIPKQSLHSIAVVHVDVHIEDAFETGFQHLGNERHVVENAEPGRLAAHGVVQPSRDVEGQRLVVQHRPGRLYGAAAIGEAGLGHPCKRRVITAGETRLMAFVLVDVVPSGKRLDDLNIVAAMHLGDFIGGGQTGVADGEIGGAQFQQSHRPSQTFRLERMLRSEGVRQHPRMEEKGRHGRAGILPLSPGRA